MALQDLLIPLIAGLTCKLLNKTLLFRVDGLLTVQARECPNLNEVLR